MMLHQTNWSTLFSLAVAYFAVAGPSLADARPHSATSSHVSDNTESLSAREVSNGGKPTLKAFKRASGNPYQAYEDSLKLSKRSTEGVFHLPVYRRESPHAKLNRRAQAPSTTTVRAAIDPQTLVVPVIVGGKAQNYTFSVTSDYNTARNVQDNPKSFDPSKSSKAKKLGAVKDVFDNDATEYTLDDMQLFGGVPLNGASLLYLDVNGNKQTISNGDLGFGLKGSGGFSDVKGKTTLEVLLASKVLAQDVFSLALGAGALTDPGVLLLGASIEAATGDSPAYSKSSKDRWALDLTVGGHKGKADLSLDSVYFTTPPDVATDLIKKAGLKPIKNQAGDIVAEVDCAKGSSKTLSIELEGVNLELSGPATVVQASEDKCHFIVQGSKQGNYPTPYTLGEAIFLSYNCYFDLSSGTPKIGFALPSKSSPPASAGKDAAAADNRRRAQLSPRDAELDAELKRRCDNNESYGYCWGCDPHDYHCDHDRRRALESVMAAERAEAEEKAASQLTRDLNRVGFCDPDDDGGSCALETRAEAKAEDSASQIARDLDRVGFCDPDDDGGSCAVETRAQTEEEHEGHDGCDPDDIECIGCDPHNQDCDNGRRRRNLDEVKAASQVERSDGCEEDDGYCFPCKPNDPDCERRRRRNLDAFCDPDDDGGSCALLPARAEARRKVAQAVAARSCNYDNDPTCHFSNEPFCDPRDNPTCADNGKRSDVVTERAPQACDPDTEECNTDEDPDCSDPDDPDCPSHPKRGLVPRGTGPYGCDPGDSGCIAFKGVPSCNPFTGQNCHQPPRTDPYLTPTCDPSTGQNCHPHKRSGEGDGPYGCDWDDSGCITFKGKPSCNPFTDPNCPVHERSNVERNVELEGTGPYGCDPGDSGCIAFKGVPSCNPFTGENCHQPPRTDPSPTCDPSTGQNCHPHKRSGEGDGPYGCDWDDSGCITFKGKPSCNPFTDPNCPVHERRKLRIPACDPEFDPTCGFAFCDPKEDPTCTYDGKRSEIAAKRLEALACDPEFDPECGSEEDPSCDPFTDPDCLGHPKRSEPVTQRLNARECDPEDDDDCGFEEDPNCNPDTDPGCLGHGKRSEQATKRLETPPLTPYCDPSDPLCPHSNEERAIGGPGHGKKEAPLVCLPNFDPPCRTAEEWKRIHYKRALPGASRPRQPHRPLLCVPGDGPECNEHNMGGIPSGPHGR